jgi:hypothetical protein
VSLPVFPFVPANCSQIRWRAQTVVHCCISSTISVLFCHPAPLLEAHDLQRHDWLSHLVDSTSTQLADCAEPRCHCHTR